MTRVFVGGLPEDVRERDLSDKFASFGRISSITIKFPPRSPPFAFIEYEEESDASKAVQKMNGRDFQGRRLRVEVSRTSSGRPADVIRRRGTQYRVQLSNLPPRMTWMELKDFLRGGGDVVQADVDRRGGGTASFATYDEMKSAIRTLDRRELEGERVRIREDRGPAAGNEKSSASASRNSSRSAMRSRSRSSSGSRSPRDRSRSRTRRRGARPPSRSRSRSRSLSPRRRSRRRSRSRSRSRSR